MKPVKKLESVKKQLFEESVKFEKKDITGGGLGCGVTATQLDPDGIKIN
jgi:hypothetical protein